MFVHGKILNMRTFVVIRTCEPVWPIWILAVSTRWAVLCVTKVIFITNAQPSFGLDEGYRFLIGSTAFTLSW